MGIVSCEEDDPIDKRLIGTWKCIGYGKKGSETIIPLEPKNVKDSYFITFKENGEITAKYSPLDSVTEKYSCYNGYLKIHPSSEYYTGGWITGDYEKFHFLFSRNLIHTYRFQNKKLFVYYTYERKEEYFVFKPKNQ